MINFLRRGSFEKISINLISRSSTLGNMLLSEQLNSMEMRAKPEPTLTDSLLWIKL